MIIKVYNDEANYNRLIKLLSDLKICEGPESVRSTLRRHPIIKDYLRRIQAENLIDIENDIAYNKDSEQ